MNKQLKFRVWDSTAKIMHLPEDGFFGINQFGDIIDLSSKTAVWARIGYVPNLMRCTGLQDKNGKDIYESDIVKHNLGFIDQRSCIAKVEFSKYEDDEQYSTWTHLGWNIDGHSLDDWNEACEIIGNIYQNPELLE